MDTHRKLVVHPDTYADALRKFKPRKAEPIDPHDPEYAKYKVAGTPFAVITRAMTDDEIDVEKEIYRSKMIAMGHEFIEPAGT